jgi:hypothetical protein
MVQSLDRQVHLIISELVKITIFNSKMFNYVGLGQI